MAQVERRVKWLQDSIVNNGGDPDKVVAGVCAFNEPAWVLLGYGKPEKAALDANGAIELLEKLLPMANDYLREQFPRALILSARIAGSTRHDLPDVGWTGRGDDEWSHGWELVRIAAKGADILQMNAYGARTSHKLDKCHEVSGLPIFVSEFHWGTLHPSVNLYRWMEYKARRLKLAYPLAPGAHNTEDSVDAVESDLFFDVWKPYMLGSFYYHWAPHAWGDGKNEPRMSYPWGPVDVTKPDNELEFVDIGWIEGAASAAAEARLERRELWQASK